MSPQPKFLVSTKRSSFEHGAPAEGNDSSRHFFRNKRETKCGLTEHLKNSILYFGFNTIYNKNLKDMNHTCPKRLRKMHEVYSH